MLRSAQWAGADPRFAPGGGKYVHTYSGGGGTQDWQMNDETPLVFWEGRSEVCGPLPA